MRSNTKTVSFTSDIAREISSYCYITARMMLCSISFITFLILHNSTGIIIYNVNKSSSSAYKLKNLSTSDLDRFAVKVINIISLCWWSNMILKKLYIIRLSKNKVQRVKSMHLVFIMLGSLIRNTIFVIS